MCSKKAQGNLRAFPMALETLSLEVTDPEQILVQLFQNDKSYQIDYKAIWTSFWHQENQYGKEVVSIDEKQYKVLYQNVKSLQVFEKNGYCAITKMAVFQETLSLISKYLNGIFNVQKISFKAIKIWKQILLPLIARNFRELETLTLSHPTDTLDFDDLSFLLDNLSVEKFELNWAVEDGVKYRKSLRYPRMTLRKANWLTGECFRNSEIVALEAHHVHLCPEDARILLDSWLEGGPLEQAHLNPFGWRFNWFPALEGIPKKPVGQEDLQKHSHLRRGISKVWEIERSDGKRAAVITDNVFIFQVLE